MTQALSEPKSYVNKKKRQHPDMTINIDRDVKQQIIVKT